MKAPSKSVIKNKSASEKTKKWLPPFKKGNHMTGKLVKPAKKL